MLQEINGKSMKKKTKGLWKILALMLSSRSTVKMLQLS